MKNYTAFKEKEIIVVFLFFVLVSCSIRTSKSSLQMKADENYSFVYTDTSIVFIRHDSNADKTIADTLKYIDGNYYENINGIPVLELSIHKDTVLNSTQDAYATQGFVTYVGKLKNSPFQAAKRFYRNEGDIYVTETHIPNGCGTKMVSAIYYDANYKILKIVRNKYVEFSL